MHSTIHTEPIYYYFTQRNNTSKSLVCVLYFTFFLPATCFVPIIMHTHTHTHTHWCIWIHQHTLKKCCTRPIIWQSSAFNRDSLPSEPQWLTSTLTNLTQWTLRKDHMTSARWLSRVTHFATHRWHHVLTTHLHSPSMRLSSISQQTNRRRRNVIFSFMFVWSDCCLLHSTRNSSVQLTRCQIR
jgi:hypothetical protein